MKPMLYTIFLLSIYGGVFAEETQDINGRIYKGVYTDDKEYRFVARILNLMSNGGSYTCSGALISDEWVLTSAYCAQHADSAIVSLGEFVQNQAQNNTKMTVLRYNVTKENMKVHPKRNASIGIYDLALFRLPEKVQLDKVSTVKTIKLPKSSKVMSYDNKNATIVGWGVIDDKNSGTIGLRMGEVHIEEHKQCKADVKEAFKKDYITNGEICIDKKISEYGFCRGDYGGPLVYPAKGKDQVVLGVSSYSVESKCSSDKPQVYAFVPYNLEWISKTTGIKTN